LWGARPLERVDLNAIFGGDPWTEEVFKELRQA
jgi:hypothetical protein